MQRSVASPPSNRIEELRIAKGLIRSEIAGQLKVDQSTLYRWEKGAAIPDRHKLALAQLFGVTVSHLMGWDDSQDADRSAA